MDEERKLFIDSIVNFPKETEELIHLNVKRIIKSTKLSEKTRNQANKLFIQKEHSEHVHEDIFRLYNHSICLAPDGSEELAFAYGNRSLLFLHMKKYENSIQDVERAIKITKSISFKIKLLCRKAECFAFMGSTEARMILEKAKVLLNEMAEHEKTISNKLISKTEMFLNNTKDNISVGAKDVYKTEMLKSLNKKEQENIYKSIAIKHNEKYGKHLVAARDIQPGEIILVEKFYAACLNLNKTFINCHHCMTVCWSGIPCNHCAWAMFCSEECKTKALENYHDIECTLIPYVKMFGEDLIFNNHVVIRLLIMAVKEAGSIAKLRAELKAIDDQKADTNKLLENVKIENKFTSVYTFLKSDYVMIESLAYALVVRVIMVFLAKYTSFFGKKLVFNNVNDLMENEDFIYAGSLFIKLFKIKQVNCYAISRAASILSCNHYGTKNIHELKLCCARGTGIALVSSFLNHSCSPNASRCFTEDKRIMIFATEPIKKNSQIFDCYDQTFFEAGKIEFKSTLTIMNLLATAKLVKTIGLHCFHRKNGRNFREKVIWEIWKQYLNLNLLK